MLFNFISDFEDIDNNDEDLIPNEQANDFSNFNIEILNSKDFQISSIENQSSLDESTISVYVTDSGINGDGVLQSTPTEQINITVIPVNDEPAINKQYDQEGNPLVFEVDLQYPSY